jgi:HD-GYP domain-containing protein (c-di-GMP phosphodiesterase class II)
MRLSFPLYDKNGGQSAFIEGIFEVSCKARKEVFNRIANSVFGAIAIVLLTTFILYPVISRLIHQLTVLTGNLVESNIETLRVIGSAIAKRDSDTDSHNYRVTIYSVELAERIGLKPKIIQGLIKGAFLHDVGKIGISDQILLKPGKLSGDEYEMMKLHVQHGIDIVKQSGWLKDAIDVVGYHHEKFAGGGYPAGLKGHEIPVNARIFAIADVFDALTSKRPYKEQLALEQSLEILNQDRQTHFDPALLDRFNEIAGPLYEQFAHGSNQVLFTKMEAIVLKYFSRDYRYNGEERFT